VRGSQKYGGGGQRVGIEIRGGTKKEKLEIIRSLLNGLVNDSWGVGGLGAPTMVELTASERRTCAKGSQVAALPRAFESLMTLDIAASDATRMFEFVNAAAFYPGQARPPASRMARFDQRACLPLLRYEGVGWVGAEAQDRAKTARRDFCVSLEALARPRSGAHDPRLCAEAIGDLVGSWANQADLQDSFKGWLGGQSGQGLFPF
jgi:hypothetical protein